MCSESEKESVYVRERECVCVCSVSEKESIYVRERESVCMCLFVIEHGSQTSWPTGYM